MPSSGPRPLPPAPAVSRTGGPPPGPVHPAPNGAVSRDLLCQHARTTSLLSWALVEQWAGAYADALSSTTATPAEWAAFLAALRENPAWHEAAAVHYLVMLATQHNLSLLAPIDRWPGLGRLLADTPAFAAALREHVALQSNLRAGATLSMTLLARLTSGEVPAWTLFAIRLLVHAGTEPAAVLSAWGETLSRGCLPLAKAQARYLNLPRDATLVVPKLHPWGVQLHHRSGKAAMTTIEGTSAGDQLGRDAHRGSPRGNPAR